MDYDSRLYRPGSDSGMAWLTSQILIQVLIGWRRNVEMEGMPTT